MFNCAARLGNAPMDELPLQVGKIGRQQLAITNKIFPVRIDRRTGRR
jgi:hypothetical protein